MNSWIQELSVASSVISGQFWLDVMGTTSSQPLPVSLASALQDLRLDAASCRQVSRGAVALRGRWAGICALSCSAQRSRSPGSKVGRPTARACSTPSRSVRSASFVFKCGNCTSVCTFQTRTRRCLCSVLTSTGWCGPAGASPGPCPSPSAGPASLQPLRRPPSLRWTSSGIFSKVRSR